MRHVLLSVHDSCNWHSFSRRSILPRTPTRAYGLGPAEVLSVFLTVRVSSVSVLLRAGVFEMLSLLNAVKSDSRLEPPIACPTPKT